MIEYWNKEVHFNVNVEADARGTGLLEDKIGIGNTISVIS